MVIVETCEYIKKHEITHFKKVNFGSSLMPSGLRIQHCHCCDSGCSCGPGSIPGLGVSACVWPKTKQNKKQKKVVNFIVSELYFSSKNHLKHDKVDHHEFVQNQ